MAIEKFRGRLNKEESFFTTVFNDTINLIAKQDLAAAGLYIYLACLPPNWEIDIDHLRKACNIGRDKAYRLLNLLIKMGAIERTITRNSGQYADYDYQLKLTITCGDSPVPEKPEAVNPEAENQDTYKRKNINKKEYKNTNSDLVKSSANNKAVKDIVEVYHEELPDNPKIKVVDTKLSNQIKKMIKDWSKYQSEGKPFTLNSFRDYLRVLREHHPGFIKPYTTKEGNIRQNNLRTFTRETNLSKLVNGEFH